MDSVLSRRRKKRTSIDTPIRVALEKSFLNNPKPTSEEIHVISSTLHMEKEVTSDRTSGWTQHVCLCE